MEEGGDLWCLPLVLLLVLLLALLFRMIFLVTEAAHRSWGMKEGSLLETVGVTVESVGGPRAGTVAAVLL